MACVAAAAIVAAVVAGPGTAASAQGPVAEASVIGGQQAPPGKFPWMAFVLDFQGKGAVQCTGTVISPRVVLTAAHCVYGSGDVLSSAEGFRVVTGAVNWTYPERQISDVLRVIPHPGFTHSDDGYGDAALLVLATPTTVPKIHLATSHNSKSLLRTGSSAMIAGWGQTYFGQKDPVEGLLWTRLKVEGSDGCEGFRGRVCAIDFPRAEASACHGDSGGPLLARPRHGKNLIEVGIAQAVFGDCSARRPTLYMRTDLIAKWVRAHLRAIAAHEPPVAPPPTPETSVPGAPAPGGAG